MNALIQHKKNPLLYLFLNCIKTTFFLFLFINPRLGICSNECVTCPTTDVTLATQTEIDAFLNLCPLGTILTVNVRVEENGTPSITNLNGLANIAGITGTLTIINNPSLSDLSGLNQVTTIGGNLDIIANGSLSSLSGLSQLTSVGGFLRLHTLANISTLSGLDQLTSIGGLLRIYATNLTSLAGLNQLSNVNDIFITSNPALSDISALSNVNSLNGYLHIGDHQQLSSFNGLHNITTIDGDVDINSHDLITSFSDFTGLTSIGGDFRIQDMNGVSNLSGFSGLQNLSGYLYLDGNDNMSELSGLTQLTSIGGYLGVWRCPLLTDLSGLEGITSVGASLQVVDNANMINLNGLENLLSIGGFILIRDNVSLTTLSGIDNITPNSITDLTLQNSNVLSTCNVQSICGYLSIPANTATISGNVLGCDSRTEVEAACYNATEALDFDGIDDIVEISNTLPVYNELTIEAWIKPRNYDVNHQTIFSQSGSNDGWSIRLQATTGKLEFINSINPVGSDVFLSQGSVTEDTWTHVAVNYSHTSKMVNIFVNGVLDVTHHITTTNPTISGGFNIGGYDNGSTAVDFFDGVIDELRIWNYAICEAELKAKINCKLRGIENGLEAMYSFNHGVPYGDNSSPAIDMLIDGTSNGRDGVLNSFALMGNTSNWINGIANTENCAPILVQVDNNKIDVKGIGNMSSNAPLSNQYPYVIFINDIFEYPDPNSYSGSLVMLSNTLEIGGVPITQCLQTGDIIDIYSGQISCNSNGTSFPADGAITGSMEFQLYSPIGVNINPIGSIHTLYWGRENVNNTYIENVGDYSIDAYGGLCMPFHLDADADGFGSMNNSVTACFQPLGYVDNNDDCDDADPAINPNATEICDNQDNSCNGLVDMDDPDLVDNTDPTLVVNSPIQFVLPPNTIADLLVQDVDAGSYDDCGIASITISQTTFGCGDIGTNTIDFTVTDVNGNSTSTSVVVEIIDPQSNCNCDGQIINLNNSSPGDPLVMAEIEISSEATFGDDTTVIYQGGSSIILGVGFVAEQGCDFIARIADCVPISSIDEEPIPNNVFSNSPQSSKTLSMDISPNPFNKTALIEFDLPNRGEARLDIYSMTGQVIKTIFDNKQMDEGLHQIEIDGTELPKGMMYFRLEMEGETVVKKMIRVN